MVYYAIDIGVLKEIVLILFMWYYFIFSCDIAAPEKWLNPWVYPM